MTLQDLELATGLSICMQAMMDGPDDTLDGYFAWANDGDSSGANYRSHTVATAMAKDVETCLARLAARLGVSEPAKE